MAIRVKKKLFLTHFITTINTHSPTQFFFTLPILFIIYNTLLLAKKNVWRQQLYRQDHSNAPFANEEAWSLLRKHQKWNALEAVDLTGDVPSQTNEALFGHDEKPQPIGKKRASKKQKSERTTNTEGSFSSFNFGEIMREEYRAKHEEAVRAYQATVENQSTQQRLKELEFLMLDTTGKDPTYVVLVNMENDRIIAKYGLPPRQQ